jgi:hypothetical protein
MQYEQPQNRERDNSREYVEQSYSLPYKEKMEKADLENESEADLYMRIFLRQIRRLTIYSATVTEYRVKPGRENR